MRFTLSNSIAEVPLPAAGIDRDLLIPDLLRAAPQVRPVLDRYGLRGCGGPLGPAESLGFFARAHDVSLDRLLAEVRDRLAMPAAVVPEGGPGPADGIYRPFFQAGIAVVLTAGAVWGAYLLVRIALAGSFAAAGLHEVNAHGHAQIFGWVGLFVMGFAYQAFPRFKHTSLAHPRLAYASLGLMLAGLVGRSVAEPLAGAWPLLTYPAMAAAGLEVIAAAAFVWVVVATWRVSGKGLAAFDYYILSSLVWFVIQAGYEAVYLAATLATRDADQFVSLVATWQAPLRDIQIHGFALLMILGVSQRFFHAFYGFPASNPRRSLLCLVGLNTAVIGEVLGLVLLRTAGHAWAGLWYGAALLLTVSAAILVHDWRLLSRPEESDRSLKFLRTAYGWLFFSLGMILFLPVYQYGLLPWLAPTSAAAQWGFSHAYYGAARHAVTVGFVSLMIVGVAAKVVPTLRGIDRRGLPALWLPFALLNAGCALRVVSQTLTDFTPVAYPLAGVSGLAEVTGLAIWGAHLWRLMRASPARVSAPRDNPACPVTPDDFVADVLDRYPELLDTFLEFGFRPLSNPLLRRTLARTVTLRGACRLLDVDCRQLVDTLNARRQPAAGHRLALPVLMDEPGAPATVRCHESEVELCPQPKS
jgi:hypothetical protein